MTLRMVVPVVVLALTGLCRAEDAATGLTLDEALMLAWERNPDLGEASTRVDEAAARLAAATAPMFPWVKVRGALDSWTEDQRLYPATRNGEPGAFGPTIASAEATAGVLLFSGGRVRADRAAAAWNRDAAVGQMERVRQTLSYNVTALFYSLLAQEQVLQALEVAVRSTEEHQRTTQALVEADKAARVDLLRANVRRAELVERLLKERTVRTTQRWAWAALLGWARQEPPDAVGTLEVADLPAPDAAEAFEKALAHRPDLRAAVAAVRAAEAGVRAARAAYCPSLSAQASYAGRWLREETDPQQGVDDHVAVGRASLSVDLPLFDGRLTSARIAEQSARLKASRERARRLELQVRFEVETAVADIAAARERVLTTQEAVAQAEESYRIMREKYDLGKGTMTDVLDAQAAFVAAQTNHARAKADLAVAHARLLLAIGEDAQ